MSFSVRPWLKIATYILAQLSISIRRSQARNHEGAGGAKSPAQYFAPLGNNVLDLKNIGRHSSKMWTPLKKILAAPGFPSWIRVWTELL